MNWRRLLCCLGLHDDVTISGTYWTKTMYGTFIIDMHHCLRCQRQVVIDLHPVGA